MLHPGEALELGVWYRSPLWPTEDHCVGRPKEWQMDEVAWCGRSLGVARDWENDELGGLWVTNRVSAHCAQCNRGEKESGQ